MEINATHRHHPPIRMPPGLAAKVAALRRPEIYPDAVERVDTVETHMSWVFLAGSHAYKLKKPVCYDFLDFSAVAAREHYCREEVRLNRRLAPDVYLDVVPLAVDSNGELELGGTGDPIDWLVKMRRLPRERMLDRLLATHCATDADRGRIAAALAGFFRALSPVAITAREYRRRIVSNLLDCLRELEAPRYALPATLLLRATTLTAAFAAHRADSLDARVAAGRIVEGHGDLRPDHICLADTPLVDTPMVIDCLEFNAALRTVDVADDLAVLALECERLGAAAFGAAIVRQVGAENGDIVPDALLHFYIAHRALVRAKLAVWHTRDVGAAEVPHWLARAREYLALADAHARACT